MKKFLKKKGVKYGFLVASIVFLILYVCLLVRPVTTITPYIRKKESGSVYSMTFNGGNKLTISDGNKSEFWVSYDLYSFDKSFLTTNMIEKDDYLETVKTKKEKTPDLYKAGLIDSNAFRIKMDSGDAFINYGAIVFAVVGAILEATLVVFTVMAIKSKKKK